MNNSTDAALNSKEGGELRRLAARGRQVWKLVSKKRKRALGLATLVLVVISAGNTSVALLLGHLVDGIQAGLKVNLSKEKLYFAAGWILLTIAVIYVVREMLNVVRRSLVGRSCIGINRDMQMQVVDQVTRVNIETARIVEALPAFD